MTPADVFEKVARAYAEFESYRDTGTVKSVTIMAGGTSIKDSSFSTAFARPDRLRFEYKDVPFADKVQSYIVWCDGTDVRTWWSLRPGVKRPESLSSAIGGATGVSQGVAARVPRLLLPNRFLGGGFLMLEVDRMDEDIDRGVQCHRVFGKMAPNNRSFTVGDKTLTVLESLITMWIDKKSFLVRRVETRTTFDAFRSEVTTVYSPEVNVEMPEEPLAFNPPEGASPPKDGRQPM